MMEPMRTLAMTLVVLLAAGCTGPKSTGIKKADPPKVPSGWKIADLPGVPFTLAVPDGMDVKAIDGKELSQANVSAREEMDITKPGLVATKQADGGMRVVTAFMGESKRSMNESAVVDGFVSGFESEGATNVKRSKIELPIGSANRVAATMGTGGQSAQIIAIMVIEDKVLYNIVVMAMGEHTGLDEFSEQVAQSFRPR